MYKHSVAQHYVHFPICPLFGFASIVESIHQFFSAFKMIILIAVYLFCVFVPASALLKSNPQEKWKQYLEEDHDDSASNQVSNEQSVTYLRIITSCFR
jgi:hypothetical protein